MNIPNVGQIENLPREAVVECSALIEKDRVTPLTLGSMPPPVAVVLQRYIACQEMLVQAVLEKDRGGGHPGAAPGSHDRRSG